VVRFLGCEVPAAGTVAWRMTRPPGFTFRAGQNVELSLASSPPGKPVSRTLSLASAPCDDELLVAARIGPSPFKAALASLRPGVAARIEGPHGSLVLHRSPGRDAVFIAGGIGITPFRSMLRQAAHERDPRRFTLVYSNPRPESAAFLGELQDLARTYTQFRLVPTMTRLAPGERSWAGERRAIGAALVRDASASLAAPIFYLAGPPAMVAAIRAALEAAGIDDDDVRGEEFFGYDSPQEDP
jgi:ferredoxin-NADP reductase